MANPTLTIQPDKARLTVTGKSWDDVSTDSGPGTTIEQITIDEIEDILDIDLPDIDDDTDIIIGIIDTDDFPDWIPEIIIGDIPVEIVDIIPPGAEEIIIDGIPVWVLDGIPMITIDDLDDMPVIIIDDPEGWEVIALPDLDLDDLDLDWEMDLGITDLDTDSLAFLDLDLNLHFEELPDEIQIAHVPFKTTYTVGQEIDLDGLQVRAYRDGEVWEGPDGKYWHGYIPVHELDYEPRVAGMNSLGDFIKQTDRCSTFCQNRHFTATSSDGAIIYINQNDELTMAVTFLSEHKGACGTFNGSTAQANTLVYSDGISTLYKSSEYRYGHNCDEQLNPYYNQYVPLDAEAIQDMLGGVTVKWKRYGDEKELTASFQITVEAKGSGE